MVGSLEFVGDAYLDSFGSSDGGPAKDDPPLYGRLRGL